MQFQKVPDIGPIVAESLDTFYYIKPNQHLIDKLLKEVKINPPVGGAVGKAKTKTGVLAGKSIVFTGTLETMSRVDAQEKARQLGANVNDSVSKNTDIVVVGANPGSKAAKAKQLGVKILNEKGYLELIN